MSNTSTESTDRQPPDAPANKNTILQGRWKYGAALLAIALIAQGILWANWWDDPTHFKMSVLFVWPAAIFFLLIWWLFFSGWSAGVRLWTTLSAAAVCGLFFTLFRFEKFDGDMVPRRIAFRWTPTREDEARKFLRQSNSKQVTPENDLTGKSKLEEPLVATDEDWPGYRGHNRDGFIRSGNFEGDWSTQPPREIWRHPVGKAWSSFAVVGDFVFTQEQRDEGESVVAYDFSTGDQKWLHVDPVSFPGNDAQGGTGPRATPTFDEGRLYTQGATGILNCLDARSGKVIWSTDILKDSGSDGQPTPNLPWGVAASPLVVDQFVVTLPGGQKGQSVVAYDKLTGKRAWAAGSRVASYGSARVDTIGGEKTILAPVGDGLVAHALDDGRELWFFPWTNGPKVNGALPVMIEDGSLVFGCGYGVGSVRLDIASTTGEKDVKQWKATSRWVSNRFRPKFNDFVLSDGHIYGLDDGTLTCVDAATGKIMWKSGRYGYGQMLLAGQKLLILSEDGRVVLVPATPSKPEVASGFQALDDSGITWNHPVVARGHLLVRNGLEAACYRLD